MVRWVICIYNLIVQWAFPYSQIVKLTKRGLQGSPWLTGLTLALQFSIYLTKFYKFKIVWKFQKGDIASPLLRVSL
jgi:hypothetical protein